MLVNSGYASNYKRTEGPRSVRSLAVAAASAIRHLQQREEFDAIVVHGNSGVSIGFATLMLIDFNLVLLRKDNDNSHGSPIEGPDGHVLRKYILLDDFVDGGETVRRVVSKIEQLSIQAGWGRPPECCAVLQYKMGTRERLVSLSGGRRVCAYSTDSIEFGKGAYPSFWGTEYAAD